MEQHTQTYPAYSRRERIADGSMHVLGVGGAITGVALLPLWADSGTGGGETVALAIYGLALMATFLASAFYHMTPWESLRPVLRRVDHAAIYLKIAGTYTPLVVLIGSLSSYMVLVVVWALAVFGMVRKLFYWQVPGRLGPVLFLVMGWMSVVIIWSLILILPGASVWLIAVGGGLYSVGVIFHTWEQLRFSNAIWHGFVVSASACFYIAIALAV